MFLSVKRAFFAALLLGLSFVLAPAHTSSAEVPSADQAGGIPIEADLPQALSADRMNVGSAFVLRVLTSWQGDTCRLSPGTLLHATVGRATKDGRGHVGELAFTLTLPCGDLYSPDVVVASLIAPPVIVGANQPIPSFFGGLNGKAGAPQPITHAFTNASESSSETLGHPLILHVNKLPRSIGNGEVYRMPHIRLILPAPGGHESTIAANNGTLHLPEYTVFILRTAETATPEAVPLPLATARPVPAPRLSIAPFLGACHHHQCTSYASGLPTSTLQPPLANALDLRTLGYKAEHDHDVPALGLGTTVHFLGDHEILLTFPTHTLVHRDGSERPTDNPQPVRAVLLDASTMNVEQVANWTIDDHNTYVWPLGPNLLIHDGRSLHVYGPGLQILDTLPLDLPLSTIQISPDSEHLLLGEIHELHTLEDHRLLRGTENHPPDEEVFWSLLDRRLHRTRSFGTTSSRVPSPTLRNEGLLELRRGRESEWFLASKGWDSTTDRLVGSLHSSCLPQLGTLPPNLLTVQGCDGIGPGRHTWIVHEDGQPMTEQTSSPQDLPPDFTKAADAPRIALLLTHASQSYSYGLAFSLGTLQSQVIRVIDTELGTPQAVVRVPEVAPYQAAFALSPRGQRLVFVSGHQLLLVDLPAKD